MPRKSVPADDIPMPALLRAARTAYGSAMRAALADAGFDDIPKNGLYVIGALRRSGTPLSRIIQELGVSKQSAGQLVDALVLRGYLEREVDDEDRRRLTVSLSERGRAVADIARKAGERVDAMLTKKVGREHLIQTRRTLMVLIAQSRTGGSP